MCHPVEERGCHLGTAEDGDPFTELQVGGDDDAGFLVEFAYQMEQQRAAGLWERDVTQRHCHVNAVASARPVL